MIFDFTGRFAAAFGFVPGSLLGAALDAISPLNVGEMGVNADDFDDVRLYRGQEDEYYFAFKALGDGYGGVLATPPMLSLKRSKKLIETEVDNSSIVVVERYGTQPYEIDWKGLLIDMDAHVFPLDKMESIHKIFEVNAEWSVSSQILNALGIESVYIRSVSFDFVEGYEDTISYTLDMRAIKPLEYQMN
jgi:hypothetical protein